MNNKVLFAGTILISVLFLGLFYFFISQRQQQLQTEFPAPPSTSQLIELTNEADFEKANQIAEKEAYSFEFLLRGEVLDFSNNTLTTLARIQNEDGTSTERIVQVIPTESVLCWPETMDAGSSQIQVKDAYFQLEPGQDLILNGQQAKQFSDLNQSQITGNYIFALVSENTRGDTNEVFTARQLAVLGC